MIAYKCSARLPRRNASSTQEVFGGSHSGELCLLRNDTPEHALQSCRFRGVGACERATSCWRCSVSTSRAAVSGGSKRLVVYVMNGEESRMSRIHEGSRAGSSGARRAPRDRCCTRAGRIDESSCASEDRVRRGAAYCRQESLQQASRGYCHTSFIPVASSRQASIREGTVQLHVRVDFRSLATRPG